MLLLIYLMSRGTLSSFNLSNIFRCCFLRPVRCRDLSDIFRLTRNGRISPRWISGKVPEALMQNGRRMARLPGQQKVQNARLVVIGGVKSKFWTETIDGFWWDFAVFVNCSVSWRFMHWRQDFELVCVSCVLPVGVGSCQACREALQKLATKRCRACDRIGSGLRDWWVLWLDVADGFHQRIPSPSVHPWNWNLYLGVGRKKGS